MLLSLGHSNNPVTDLAVEDIISQCGSSLAGVAPSFGIVFTSRMDADFQIILNRIMRQWPDIQLTGCTTDGEISDVFPCTEDSISLLLIHSHKISFSTGLGENFSRDPRGAVRQALSLAEKNLRGDPVLALVLADGLETFSISLDKVICQVLGHDLPVFGALAGDHYQFRRTFQFCGNKAVSDGFVLILLSGPLSWSMNLCTGWKPIGRTFKVGRYKNNVVWEIDNMPAADFLEKYLGRNQAEYSQFPLAVLSDEDGFVLRDPVFVNQTDGSVSFVGTFPDNPMVRLTEFSRDNLLQASDKALTLSLAGYPGDNPDLALVFSCTSRRHILGTAAAGEHQVIINQRKNYPATRIFGMYAYGELGPVKESGRTRFHNDTYAVLLMGEPT